MKWTTMVALVALFASMSYFWYLAFDYRKSLDRAEYCRPVPVIGTVNTTALIDAGYMDSLPLR